MSDNPLIEFEHLRKLETWEACRILGLPYSTYMRNRRLGRESFLSSLRALAYSVEAMSLLTDEQFDYLRRRRMTA